MYVKIDKEAALAQLGDSKKLYRTIVKGFYDKYEHVDKEIEALIHQYDYEDARRMAHSIKGLSGNLGAKALREKALNLEHSIHERNDEVEYCLDEFSKELALVFLEVQEILKDMFDETAQSEIKISHEIDEEKGITRVIFDEKCRELISALETYKYSEVTYAMEAALSVEMPFSYVEMFKITQAYILNYDYDLAIKSLKEMMRK